MTPPTILGAAARCAVAASLRITKLRPVKLTAVVAGIAGGPLLGLLLLSAAITAAAAADNEKPPQIPWDLNTLFKTPQFQPAADFDTDGVRGIFFDGLPWKGKPTRVFAFIGMPDHKAGEKVPAMVLIHGGGGTAFAKWVKFWNSRGYAAIAMDTCGSVPRGKSGDWERHENGGPGTAPGGSGRFTQIDEPIEDQWTYHAVADAILANSLLRSLPDVDKDRIGLTGISWGGFVTCIVASLDDRFRFAAPVYGCGFIGDNSTWLPEFLKMGKDKAAAWLRSWDPSHYLPRAKIPFLWLNGTNDFAYPLDSYQKSYRSPAGERTLCVKVRMPHGHNRDSENAQEICAFADHLLRKGPPLARITAQGSGEGKVWATFEATTPIAKAELNFTKDVGDGVHIRFVRVANTRTWSKRTWETIPADLDTAQHKVTAAIPAGATVCYLNLIDDNGLVVSTEHVEAAAGAMEGEMMRIVATTGKVEPVDSVSRKVQDTSGGGHLWWRGGQKPGDSLILGFTVPQAGKQRVFGRFVKGPEFGIAQLAINDEKAGEPLDFCNDEEVLTAEIELGTFDLDAGENRLAITITGANEKAGPSHMVGLDYVRFEPAK